MSGAGLNALLLRFTLGFAASVGAGWLRFRGDVFLPGTRPFHCVTIGALAAGLFALVRTGRVRGALLLVVGFGFMQVGLSSHLPWPRMVTSLIANTFAAGGIWVVAYIFDQLAERGLRIGKFLISGPLLGGVYLAITPLATWGMYTMRGTVTNLLANLWLGILIGNAVGLGIELAELVPGLSGRQPPKGHVVPSGVAGRRP